MKKGFVLYNDQYEPIKALSQEQKGDLLDAIFQYQRDGTQPENGTMVSMAFSFFKIAFDRDEDKYLKRCEKNRENARIRWDATACDGIRMDAKHADSDRDRDSDSDRDRDSDTDRGTKEHIPPTVPEPKKEKVARKVFKPPTVEEVAAYCTEKGSGIDPEYFVDYHIARDWILSNGKKMKDWKATVRTWSKNNFNKGKFGNGKRPQQKTFGSDYHPESSSGKPNDLF